MFIRHMIYFLLIMPGSLTILPVHADTVLADKQMVLREELESFNVLQNLPEEITLSRSIAEPDAYEAIVGPYLFYVYDDNSVMYRDALPVLQESKSAEQLNRFRLQALSVIDESSMIVFQPPNVEHTLTIFVDVDCPYSADMFRQTDELMAAGIKVRYMVFPRAEIGSPRFARTVGVWCSEDRHQWLGKELDGIPAPIKSCEHPLELHYEIAYSLGLDKGSPTLVFDNGRTFVGYLPSAKVIHYFKDYDDSLLQESSTGNIWRDDEDLPVVTDHHQRTR